MSVILGIIVCFAAAAMGAIVCLLVIQRKRIPGRPEAQQGTSPPILPGARVQGPDEAKAFPDPNGLPVRAREYLGAPSLFIVSLPRSFSSITYLAAQRALIFKRYPHADDGEILNADRYPNYTHVGKHVWKRFSRRELDPSTYHLNRLILDHLVQPTGFIYKDVVQPFVVADWLSSRELRILHLKRNLADVAFAMLQKGWLYPSQASERRDDPELAFLEGLILADEALSRLPAVRADYDDLVENQQALWDALGCLYPGRRLFRGVSGGYINEAFRAQREVTLARRKTAEYRRLQERIDEARQSIAPLLLI